MDVVTLIISVVALGTALIAFMGTRGVQGLRRRLETVGAKTVTARHRTADALDPLEHLIRRKETPRSLPQHGSGRPSAPGGRP